MTTQYDKKIGKRMKQLRKHYGYSQQQLANYLKINQSHYSKIEQGKRRLSKLSQLESLCNLYGCQQEYLLLKTDKYVPQKWKGADSFIDLKAIAQANATMSYLKLLRNIQKIDGELGGDFLWKGG